MRGVLSRVSPSFDRVHKGKGAQLAAFGAPLTSRVCLNVWIPQKECPINQELGIRVLTHREPEPAIPGFC
jgi:hypothetical protein